MARTLPTRTGGPTQNCRMGLAVLLGGLVVLSLFVLGATLLGSRRSAKGPASSRSGPWCRSIAFGVVLVGIVLVIVPRVPTLVIVGSMAYTGVAVAAMWRMAQLDRGSRWMEPSQRRFRLGISIVALAWLGIVLGLLLWIAAYIAGGPTVRSGRRAGVR